MVKPVHGIVDLLVSDFEQAGVLGKELAQQAIGILIEPTLPRAVWVRKVHIGLQALGDELMLGKLLAIVKGQRLALLLVGAQQINDGLRHPGAVARAQLAGQGVA